MEQQETPDLGHALLYLWRLSRPEAWMVSVLPTYIGWVLASEQLFPGLAVFAGFLETAATDGATWAMFLDMAEAWFLEARRVVLALLIMGPAIWIATLLWNDVHDLEGDRRNPRKATSPLVQGLVSRSWANAMAYGFATASFLLAWLLGTGFAVVVAANLALAWLYSVPPVRLKTRPGADLAVNAIGIGLLSGLAGWSLAAPLAQFPYLFAPQALLVATAVYVPTTLVDHDADKASGYLTLATHLGPRRAYRIGWYAWLLSNLGALLLAWNDWIIPRTMLPVLVIFAPLLVFSYHYLIGRATSPTEMVKGIILCSLLFVCVNLVFALMYTGLWVT